MVAATFRADASLQIGAGHVMRCVVLANELAAAGVHSHFLMRDEPGHMADWVAQNGHAITLLPAGGAGDEARLILDAMRSRARTDWLIVDHYRLDEDWERQVAVTAHNVLVVDDLANRNHCCNILLDQNAGRTDEDYAKRVAPDTRCLLGPRYALMAPVFRQWRTSALARRDQVGAPARLLISMGGVDQANMTEQVLSELDAEGAGLHQSITVVLGRYAPHINRVRARIATMRTPTQLHVDTPSMAQLLCDADLAIGAGGVSALERCVLGLPTIVISVADNQVPGARALARAGAVSYIGGSGQVAESLIDAWRDLRSSAVRQAMSYRASQICDGAGAGRVVSQMIGDSQNE